MVFVFFGIAVLCALLAYKGSDSIDRMFFVGCCVLNLVGAAVAIGTDDPYAFKLRPPIEDDVIYRR
jgi:hypothetical protein